MTGRTTQTFHGWDQPQVVVTLPADPQHAGEHKGSLRAWAVDDETGDWWGQCEYHVSVGIQMLGWIHLDHVRPVVEVTDDGGLVDPGKIIALPRQVQAPSQLAATTQGPEASPS